MAMCTIAIIKFASLRLQTLTIILFNLVTHRSLAFDLVPRAVAQCCLAYSPRLLPDPSGVKLHSGRLVVDLGAAC